MNHELRWEVTYALNAPDSAAVDAGLDAFNRSAADFASIKKLACFARALSGAVVAGAVGRYWGEACELQQIWVRDDLRRSGIGTKLVHAFAQHARVHGCKLLYLETFSFQAPDFYRRLGFDVGCELPGFPGGMSKLIMKKALDPP
jgi:N-acetylglutamate synthase-like GNAT family acetyltransferase